MSKSKYKIYNGKSLKKIYENSRVFVLIAMLSVGIVAGASVLKSSPNFSEDISSLIGLFSSSRAEQGIIVNFINSFAVNGIFIFINLFLGFSVIGYPFLLILPLLKGLGVGAISGYLYSAHKFYGLCYCLFIVYPVAVVASFALIQACNDSIEYSKNAYLKAVKGRGQYEKDETRVYLSRQLVFLGLSALSSVIDVITCEFFSGLFEI